MMIKLIRSFGGRVVGVVGVTSLASVCIGRTVVVRRAAHHHLVYISPPHLMYISPLASVCIGRTVVVRRAARMSPASK